ncbi:unnamed protein product [Durusdinium trenchii]|uniref:Uncharacterized protein n=2 Tax=Durusdinium trenchii TaxID=1381693 RepID=A0ABP0PWX2_9DINO
MAARQKLQVPGGSAPLSRNSSKKLTRSGSKLGKASKSSSRLPQEPALPGGWQTSTDRLRFLQKLDRHGPYRENERLERLEALMELRAHALRYQNCWHLWKDEEVRDCLLDALEAPDPERGKSLYVEEGPPPNHPSVRTAAFGILVQLALDEAVREEMAQHELLRASVVEALRPEMKEDTVSGASLEGSPTASNPASPASSRPMSPTSVGSPTSAEDETVEIEMGTPIPAQSRAQQLLAMLLPSRVCAKVLQRAAPDDEDEDEDFIWMEESEEEEEMEDDPVLDPTKDPTGEMSSDLGQMDSVDKAEAQPEAPAEAEGGAESEADPDALLAEVEDILTAKKPSSDEDLLDALVTAACPDAEQLLQLDSLPPWRPGAALARRLDSLWTLAATRDNAESGQLCRFERVKEALLFGADVTQPDCVRISALGALTALMARNENKQSMWQDPEVQKVLVSGAADQIFAPSSEVSQHQLRPQATELRLQALLGLSMLAECDELRPEIWQDQRLVASLQDAVEKPGPLRPIALQVLQHLSQSWENREDMIKAEIPKLIGAALPEVDKRMARACEITRDRLLAA